MIMRKIISLALLTIFLIGCGITNTATKGIENQAFLLFVGTPSNYPNGVQVVLDDKTKFNAEVHKNSSKIEHLRVYGISTGTHKVVVLSNNKTVYEKLIFLSSQQTKKIILP